MGYFNTSGQYQDANPRSKSLTNYPVGSPGHKYMMGRMGVDSDQGVDRPWRIESEENRMTGNLSGEVYNPGQGAGIGGHGMRGMIEQSFQGYLPTNSSKWHGYTPMGAQMLGSSARGYMPGKKWGYTGARDAALDKANALWDEKIGGESRYAGPSFSGGWQKEFEDFSGRKTRLLGLPQWQGSADAETVHLGGQQTGTETDRFSQFGEVGADEGGLAVTPFKAADAGQLQNLVKQEFGASKVTPDQLQPWEGSDEQKELQTLESDRESTFGDIYRRDESESGFDKTQTVAKGLIDYLKPGAGPQGGSNVFNLEYGEEDDLSTPWNETTEIDWDRTLGEGGTFKSNYEDAIRTYMAGEKGLDNFAQDSSEWGTWMNKFLDESIPDYESTITDQAKKQGYYSDIEDFEGQLAESKATQKSAAAGTRSGLLDQLMQSEARKYSGGFAAMGERPNLQGQKKKLLEQANIGLVGSREMQQGLRGQIAGSHADIAAQQNIEDEFLSGIHGPWSKLESTLADEYGGIGPGNIPQHDWAGDLWGGIEAGYPA